jgi:hypothetical protein
MADYGQERDLEAMAMAAEPAECSRRVLMCLLGFVGFSFIAVAVVLLGYIVDVGDHGRPPDPRLPPHVARLVMILSFALGVGPFGLFLFLIQEWDLGNPEGERLVDTLLLL